MTPERIAEIIKSYKTLDDLCESIERQGKLLTDVADALSRAPRIGNSVDVPEGARFIQISDTLAKELEQRCRELAKVK